MMWRDYYTHGWWNHALLYDEEGTLVATCFAQETLYGRPDGVMWEVEGGPSGRSDDRRTAKREARNALKARDRAER